MALQRSGGRGRRLGELTVRKRSPGGVAASRVGCKRNNGKETVEISLKEKKRRRRPENGLRRRQTRRRGSYKVGGGAAAARIAAAHEFGLWINPRGGGEPPFSLSCMRRSHHSSSHLKFIHQKKPPILSSPLPLNRREKERGLP